MRLPKEADVNREEEKAPATSQESAHLKVCYATQMTNHAIVGKPSSSNQGNGDSLTHAASSSSLARLPPFASGTLPTVLCNPEKLEEHKRSVGR
jgi:hypothetical protein